MRPVGGGRGGSAGGESRCRLSGTPGPCCLKATRDRVGRRCRPSRERRAPGSTSATHGGTCFSRTAATPDVIETTYAGHYQIAFGPPAPPSSVDSARLTEFSRGFWPSWGAEVVRPGPNSPHDPRWFGGRSGIVTHRTAAGGVVGSRRFLGDSGSGPVLGL